MQTARCGPSSPSGANRRRSIASLRGATRDNERQCDTGGEAWADPEHSQEMAKEALSLHEQPLISTGPSSVLKKLRVTALQLRGRNSKKDVMPQIMPIGLRELARLTGLSTRTLGRLALPRTRDKQFDLMAVIWDLAQRLLLAERLCNRWCPGELEARLSARSDAFEPPRHR
jgi:hypothetical protein